MKKFVTKRNEWGWRLTIKYIRTIDYLSFKLDSIHHIEPEEMYIDREWLPTIKEAIKEMEKTK